VPLQILLPDGQAGLHVHVSVVTPLGVEVFESPLTDRGGGFYSTEWVPAVEGYFSALYDAYLDSDYTVPAEYERGGEQIEVSTDKIQLARLLGLQHENSVVDSQTYSNTGKLTGARIRAYADAQSATSLDPAALKHTWFVRADYGPSDQLVSYKILRSDQ
jgi:hypothetical protein